MDAYIRQSLNHELLSREDEYRLVPLAQHGDREAAEEIFVKNQRLVFRIAERYYYSGGGGDQELQDLVQWGNIGLHRAIQKFDPSRGLRFSTYAFDWIRLWIQRMGTLKGSTFGMSFGFSERCLRVRSRSTKMYVILKREPTVQELSEATRLPKDIVKDALVTRKVFYLDEPIKADSGGGADWGDESSSLLDTLVDEEADTEADAVERVLIDAVLQEVKLLPPKLAYIIRRRFGLEGCQPATLLELEKELGISRERIRQHEARALFFIREALNLNSIN